MAGSGGHRRLRSRGSSVSRTAGAEASCSDGEDLEGERKCLWPLPSGELTDTPIAAPASSLSRSPCRWTWGTVGADVMTSSRLPRPWHWGGAGVGSPPPPALERSQRGSPVAASPTPAPGS